MPQVTLAKPLVPQAQGVTPRVPLHPMECSLALEAMESQLDPQDPLAVTETLDRVLDTQPGRSILMALTTSMQVSLTRCSCPSCYCPCLSGHNSPLVSFALLSSAVLLMYRILLIYRALPLLIILLSTPGMGFCKHTRC